MWKTDLRLLGRYSAFINSRLVLLFQRGSAAERRKYVYHFTTRSNYVFVLKAVSSLDFRAAWMWNHSGIQPHSLCRGLFFLQMKVWLCCTFNAGKSAKSLQLEIVRLTHVPLTCEKIWLYFTSLSLESPLALMHGCVYLCSQWAQDLNPPPPSILSFIPPQLCVYLPLPHSLSVSNWV